MIVSNILRKDDNIPGNLASILASNSAQNIDKTPSDQPGRKYKWENFSDIKPHDHIVNYQTLVLKMFSRIRVQRRMKQNTGEKEARRTVDTRNLISNITRRQFLVKVNWETEI